ncbi:MAG: hypothetical protein P1V51_08505 [Deltaproteobacteria bacterium]|nr:hypothetical protein [Deltaproteobacteria bacterium]
MKGRHASTGGSCIVLFALLLAGGCPSAKTERKEATMDPRAIVDAALKKNGDLGAYGDLSAGLAALEAEFDVRIEVEGEVLLVDAGPHSGEGHDFSFKVLPATLELKDVVIGELDSEPEP